MKKLRGNRKLMGFQTSSGHSFRYRVSMVVLITALLLTPVISYAGLNTYKAISNVNELNDGDKIILVSKGTSTEFDCKNKAIGNKYNVYNGGLSIIDISSFITDDIITMDDNSNVAIFYLKKGADIDEKPSFAMQVSLTMGEETILHSYWIKAGEIINPGTNNYKIAIDDKEDPSSVNFAKFFTNINNGTYIDYISQENFVTSHHYLAYDDSGFFRASSKTTLSDNALLNTWFDIYVLQGSVDPTQGEASFGETEYEYVVESDIELKNILTTNSNAVPVIELKTLENTVVDESDYTFDSDPQNPVLTVNKPGIYDLMVTYPATSLFTQASATTRLIVPDKDYTVWFAVNGEKVESDSITDIETGASIEIHCASESAQLYYTDSFIGETEREYKDPLTVRSGRTEFVAIAYFNEQERSRTKLVVRTSAQNPSENVLSFNDELGLTDGLSGDEYEPLPINIEVGKTYFRTEEGEKVRLATATDDSHLLEIAPQGSIIVGVNDKSLRITSIAIETEGDVALDIYKVKSETNPQMNTRSRVIRRVDESKLEAVGDLTGNGNALWDDTGDVDLSELHIKNNTDTSAFLRTISTSTASHTVTGIDSPREQTDFEWYTIAGLKVNTPTEAGLYIRRDPATGRTLKIIRR